MPERPNPARVVADADVLAADLFGIAVEGGGGDEGEGGGDRGGADGGDGGDRSRLAAREALDQVRRHSWVELVASDPLLDDAETVVAALADDELAADHRERLERERVRVEQPADDHPALASAYRGNAAHLLSFDERLTSAAAGLTLRSRVRVSVRTPDAFTRLFDPESLYGAVVGGAYPGPDRDPRD